MLATLGRRGLLDPGAPVPANARVVDVVDFAAVLPHAAVFVTNGGWGGVLAALAAGVPVIVAPGTAADKPEVARLVARSGAGLDLRRRRASSRAVAEAVRRVLADPRYPRAPLSSERNWRRRAGRAGPRTWSRSWRAPGVR